MYLPDYTDNNRAFGLKALQEITILVVKSQTLRI